MDSTDPKNVIEFCVNYLALSVVRPTEEQRELLEAKFEQDRRFEELRKPLSKEYCKKNNLCYTCSGALEFIGAYDICKVCDPTRYTELVALMNEPLEKEEVEVFWPFMRCKNFINWLVLTNRKRNVPNRLSHRMAIEILAKHMKTTVETFLKTNPIIVAKKIGMSDDEARSKLRGYWEVLSWRL